MSRGSPALTAARKEEIIQACAKLNETMSFKEITIKEIGAATSFTRTSIYNYFETKEEIFLALLQREYESGADASKIRPKLDAKKPVSGSCMPFSPLSTGSIPIPRSPRSSRMPWSRPGSPMRINRPMISPITA